jgi:ribosomal protein S21
MKNPARVRVELKNFQRPGKQNTSDQRWTDFKSMLSAFNRAVINTGLMNTLKAREFYESPGEKRRRKKKEANLTRMKSKLKKNFPINGNNRRGNNEQ